MTITGSELRSIVTYSKEQAMDGIQVLDFGYSDSQLSSEEQYNRMQKLEVDCSGIADEEFILLEKSRVQHIVDNLLKLAGSDSFDNKLANDIKAIVYDIQHQ